ncbi:metal-sensing transcriptional repressor [Butyrivibrio fibrisolvens]|uniref:metal-sensing transcriptional repressor n=1 Tax=Butyrivibrio fibrisolvens TaxID=831 RepID=UPI00041C133D|nr:metal-sensing transcriptional repressor [Butyrivibrio fibrisolvens]
MKKRDDIKTHTHIDENGHEYTHTHEDYDHVHAHDNNAHEGHDHAHTHHSHSHTHDPKEMKKIINRISKSIGHMESIKRMLENGEDCADVLVQIAAVKSEINNAGKALLKEHLDHCIVEAVAQNDTESVDKMNKAIDYFMK